MPDAEFRKQVFKRFFVIEVDVGVKFAAFKLRSLAFEVVRVNSTVFVEVVLRINKVNNLYAFLFQHPYPCLNSIFNYFKRKLP